MVPRPGETINEVTGRGAGLATRGIGRVGVGAGEVGIDRVGIESKEGARMGDLGALGGQDIRGFGKDEEDEVRERGGGGGRREKGGG